MRMLLWSWLWLPAAAVCAAAVPVQEDDFAYGLPIQLSGEAAIYRMVLPEVVYSYLSSADFSDMRIFNAAGEVVPHSLRRPVAPEPDTGDTRVVPFFPYAVIKPGAHSPVQVRVIVNDQGTVVSSSAAANTDAAERVSAYLIDASALQDTPSSLVLDWESPEDSFVASIRIEGSDDLDHWQTLVPQASLVRLLFSGRELARREIELPDRAYKYLKLGWPATADGVRLTEVTASFSQRAEPVEPVWTALRGSVVAGEPGSFEYRTRGHLPVERADVALPEGNSLVDVKLFSRAAENTPWRMRHSGSFYRLQVDGASLTSEPAVFPSVTDPLWRLEAVSDLSGLGAAAPVLRLGYIPHELYFLARGEPPYVLAFGAHAIAAGPARINALLDRIDDRQSDTFIGAALAGEMITLGGAEKLRAQQAPFPWQQFILWSVLVLGVCILGIMAWRLGKQMQ